MKYVYRVDLHNAPAERVRADGVQRANGWLTFYRDVTVPRRWWQRAAVERYLVVSYPAERILAVSLIESPQ